ncbi:MAG: FAD-dependent oxidoreductase [Acidobacteria bacterium]|nr:FAD-dependent oxidoreductase [Acidobacteriota bacterium]
MIVVIGAGVTGLACALSLAQRGRDVVVLERHRRAGLDTSTHNSGVIHAGLYYLPGSLKATLCVEGRDRLKQFCRAHQVPHHESGKLVVATEPSEEPDLEPLAANARASGVDVELVDAAFVRAREPHVRATRALWSPHTGWIDAHAFVSALQRQVEAHGGHVLPGSPVLAVEPAGDRVEVVTPLERIDADAVVNAAGLYADDVSRLCDGEPFTIYPCRGEYAELTPKASRLINGLVYPVPHGSGHGLGVHLTRTVDGTVWVGPTIRYQSRKDDYEADREPLTAFLEPTRRLLPAVMLSDLRLGGSGIRAKAHPATERFADFLIRSDRRRPWLTHAAGIDSPGLTASLAIGERVADIVGMR